MKTIAELLLGIADDPDKERLRQEIRAQAREWEESDVVGEACSGEIDATNQETLIERLRRAVEDPQRCHVLETMLDSWGL